MSFFGVLIFFVIIIVILTSNKTGQVRKNNLVRSSIKIEEEYLKSENEIVEDIIKAELQKNNYNGKSIVEVERKKFRVTTIFSVLNFILISLVFFHLPIYWYLLEIVNIAVYMTFIKRYNIIKYLKREIKARPDDNISDIISSVLTSGVVNKNKVVLKEIVTISIAFILPLIIFIKPITFYEKSDDGYYLRFYTTGLIHSSEITIPEAHKNNKVVGIRGDVFANIRYVKRINLPNSINTIRGKAFENDSKLEEISLPENLTYLGGGAFRNCKSLKSITIPSGVTVINGGTFENCTSLEQINLHDEITEIHGETFKNCKSLVSIKLPTKITEIKGNTFENCTSIKNIDIPDGVTRIGGHAFYGCTSLESVAIPTSLKEIGSSAFRMCNSLLGIMLPKGTKVKENSFKESPTKVIFVNVDGEEVVEENDDPATNLNKIVDNLTNNVITNNENITNITNARNTTNENGIKKQPLLVNPIPIQK